MFDDLLQSFILLRLRLRLLSPVIDGAAELNTLSANNQVMGEYQLVGETG